MTMTCRGTCMYRGVMSQFHRSMTTVTCARNLLNGRKDDYASFLAAAAATGAKVFAAIKAAPEDEEVGEAFRLPEEELRQFAAICERYLLYQLDIGFKTLDFYHEVTSS